MGSYLIIIASDYVVHYNHILTSRAAKVFLKSALHNLKLLYQYHAILPRLLRNNIRVDIG